MEHVQHTLDIDSHATVLLFGVTRQFDPRLRNYRSGGQLLFV